MVAADNTPAAAETAVQMNFYSLTLVQPQSVRVKDIPVGNFRNETLSDTYARTRA